MSPMVGSKARDELVKEYLATFTVRRPVRRTVPFLSGLREAWDALRDLVVGRWA